MSLILNDVSYHIQMTKIDENQQEKMIFPVNTINDVIVSEDGQTLSEYLPTVDNDPVSPTEKAPFCVITTGDETIPDSVFANLINA